MIRARRAQPGRSDAAAAASPLPLSAARSRFVLEVRRALFGPCGVAAGATVVVGVSGGADSMALMLALSAIAWRSSRSGGMRPVVVHVHHHLRGRAADLDAAFVKREAARLGLPFELRHVRPAAERGSTAAAARRLRYAALAQVALERGADVVAVGHHADDQLESMLMAIGRGAGLAGLGGMAFRRSLDEEVPVPNEHDPDAQPGARPAAEGLALIRPLLHLDKAGCEAFCRDAGRRWRTDATNADREAPRVRLRREVLPVLEALWPGAARRAATTARLVREAGSALEGAAARRSEGDLPGALSLSRSALVALPPVVAGMRLCKAHARLMAEDPARSPRRVQGPPTLGSRHVEAALRLAALGGTGKRATSLAWPGGVTVRVFRDEVTLVRDPRRAKTRTMIARPSRTDSKTSRPRLADTA